MSKEKISAYLSLIGDLEDKMPSIENIARKINSLGQEISRICGKIPEEKPGTFLAAVTERFHSVYLFIEVSRSPNFLNFLRGLPGCRGSGYRRAPDQIAVKPRGLAFTFNYQLAPVSFSGSGPVSVLTRFWFSNTCTNFCTKCGSNWIPAHLLSSATASS